MFLVCERWVGNSGRTAILTSSSSSTIAAFLPHFGWVAQPWVTEVRKLSVCKLILTLASYLKLIRTAPVISFSDDHLLPLFFRLFTQVRLLIDDSVEGQYITGKFLSHFLIIIIIIMIIICTQLYSFKYSYLIQIFCTVKYSYQILIFYI